MPAGPGLQVLVVSVYYVTFSSCQHETRHTFKFIDAELELAPAYQLSPGPGGFPVITDRTFKLFYFSLSLRLSLFRDAYPLQP